MIKEEEERQKQLEYIKEEWEEKFDREQKAKELKERLRDQNFVKRTGKA